MWTPTTSVQLIGRDVTMALAFITSCGWEVDCHDSVHTVLMWRSQHECQGGIMSFPQRWCDRKEMAQSISQMPHSQPPGDTWQSLSLTLHNKDRVDKTLCTTLSLPLSSKHMYSSHRSWTGLNSGLYLYVPWNLQDSIPRSDFKTEGHFNRYYVSFSLCKIEVSWNILLPLFNTVRTNLGQLPGKYVNSRKIN